MLKPCVCIGLTRAKKYENSDGQHALLPNHFGGAEATVKSIAEELVKLGHSVTVASLSRDGAEQRQTVNGVQCVYLHIDETFWLQDMARWRAPLRILRHIIDLYNFSMGWRFKKLLAEIKPDIVVAHNIRGFSPSIWRAAQVSGIPLCQMIHDYFLVCGNSTMFRDGKVCEGICTRCRVNKVAVKMLAHIPRAYISNSRYTQSVVQQAGLFSDDVQAIVINPAIPIPANVALRDDKAPGQNITFGFLGRVEQTKGVEVLLQAFQQVSAPHISLQIGGNGYADYVDVLKEAYKDPRVTFLGRVDADAFLSKIDVLVVPSKWNEPFGRVIVEAYSHGVPVIASSMGGMTELVTPGETGELFASEDVSQLASIIQKIADQGLPAKKYSENCLRRSHDFSEINMVKKYEAVLHSVLRHYPNTGAA